MTDQSPLLRSQLLPHLSRLFQMPRELHHRVLFRSSHQRVGRQWMHREVPHLLSPHANPQWVLQLQAHPIPTMIRIVIIRAHPHLLEDLLLLFLRALFRQRAHLSCHQSTIWEEKTMSCTRLLHFAHLLSVLLLFRRSLLHRIECRRRRRLTIPQLLHLSWIRQLERHLGSHLTSIGP